jgi:CheY-like chemotaxis protein
MHHKLVLLVVTGALWLIPGLVQGQNLFNDARSQTRLDLGRADSSGVTVRGGVDLRTYLPETTTTLFQTNARIGGTCGAFDFVTSLRQTFEEIPALFEELGQALLSQMPMLVLCYVSPTLCDLYKHFQSLVNTVLQARYAQCQDLQNAAAAAGLMLRGGEAARCLETEQQRGTSLNLALSRCLGEVSSLRSPTGNSSTRVELVRETLEAAGVDPEIIALVRAAVGEVTLTAGGATLGAQQQHPHEGLHRRYETFRDTAAQRLDEAALTLATGGTPTDDVLLDVSLPGQSLPRAALEALATMRQDPVRYESLRQRLAAGLAITRLTWEVHQIQQQLDAAETANAQLTEEERRLLQSRQAALQRELTRVQQEKEVAERHLLPVVHALLAEYAAVQSEASRVGFQATSPEVPPVPFRRGGQVTLGYGY